MENKLSEEIKELREKIKVAKKDLAENIHSIESQVWWSEQIKVWKDELKQLLA